MGFTLPQLNSCCCGCTLRTGTLIILWVYLIFGLLFGLSPYAGAEVKATSQSISFDGQQSQSKVTTQANFRGFGVWQTLFSLVNVVLCALGLYAVYKEIHVYLVPFLIGELILQAILLIGYLFTGNFQFIVGDIIGILIFLYFWLVVYSHYRVLKGTARPIQA